MNPRYLLVLIGVGVIIVRGPATLLADMNRRRGAVLAAILAAAGLAAWGVQTGPGAAAWQRVSAPVVMAPIAVAALLGLGVYALLDRRRARRRVLAGRWSGIPSEQEFGRFRVAALERLGWQAHTLHGDVRLTICRMEKQPRRVTAIVMSHSRMPSQVATILTRMRWKPYGRTVLVPRSRPLPEFVDDARRLGWSVLGSDQLDAMQKAYEGWS